MQSSHILTFTSEQSECPKDLAAESVAELPNHFKRCRGVEDRTQRRQSMPTQMGSEDFLSRNKEAWTQEDKIGVYVMQM